MSQDVKALAGDSRPADTEGYKLAQDTPNEPENGRPPIDEDSEMQGLSLYEKKAILVNRELASQGMGRYQWMIFCLCGFGYFLDLLWAQTYGLILAQVQQEFGFGDDQLGNLNTSFSAGLTAGAAFWGILVDVC